MQTRPFRTTDAAKRSPTIGSDWLLPGFAALVIGGVQLEGGKVAVLGVLFGVAILELIGNALAINRIDPYWVTLLQGGLILAAVSLQLFRSASTRLQRSRLIPRFSVTASMIQSASATSLRFSSKLPGVRSEAAAGVKKATGFCFAAVSMPR